MKLDRIRALRLEHKLSQIEVAKELHITQRSYSHYETGTRTAPLEVLIGLCDYYQVTLDYIVGRTDR